MAPIEEGDKVPSVEMDLGFPPKKVNMADYVKGKPNMYGERAVVIYSDAVLTMSSYVCS